MHPFFYVMIATFAGAVFTLFVGIGNMGVNKGENKATSNRLMVMRVVLCLLLLLEILFYHFYLSR